MIYRRFWLGVISYVSAIVLLASGFAFYLGKDLIWASIFLLIMAVATFSFVFWLNRTNRKLAYFFNAARNEDTSIHFPAGEGFADEKLLNKSLNDLNEILRLARLNIEKQERFYRNILETISTGIITFHENGNVEFANSEAKRIFGLQNITHINRLAKIDPRLTEMFGSNRTGDQRQLNVKVGNTLMKLAVHAQKIRINGEELRALTFQDIRSELDMQEMDSWQKLIRILNHEIMNSVAPITSLSSTISGYFRSGQEQVTPGYISEKMISDTIKGLDIIEDHSRQLLRFVESYRSITQLPKPEFSRVNIHEFLERIKILIYSTYTEGGSHPGISIDAPGDLMAVIDDGLIARALINIIKNAAEAFTYPDQGNEISITAFRSSEGRMIIAVKDNGPGMDQETAEKIFVPFFTTKPTGSGIGLSLARQIMRIHNGNITCDTAPGKGTCISLIF